MHQTQIQTTESGYSKNQVSRPNSACKSICSGLRQTPTLLTAAADSGHGQRNNVGGLNIISDADQMSVLAVRGGGSLISLPAGSMYN